MAELVGGKLSTPETAAATISLQGVVRPLLNGARMLSFSSCPKSVAGETEQRWIKESQIRTAGIEQVDARGVLLKRVAFGMR